MTGSRIDPGRASISSKSKSPPASAVEKLLDRFGMDHVANWITTTTANPWNYTIPTTALASGFSIICACS